MTQSPMDDAMQQELQGEATPEIYANLLLHYLIQDDAPAARLVYKRIPVNIMEQHPELKKIWQVGAALADTNLALFHQRATSFSWSENHVRPLMQQLQG